MNKRRAGNPLIALIPAILLWIIVFRIRPFPFFISMSLAASVLGGVALWLGNFKPIWMRPRIGDIAGGILSALVLYFVFVAGNHILTRLASLSGTESMRRELLKSVYAGGEGFSPLFTAILLAFPIAACEELFWRGYLQNALETRYSKHTGFWLTAAAYTLVHLPTWNPVLILAAAVCGLFWGFLYMRYQSLMLVIISHMIWDPLIFVVFPLQ